MKSFRFLAILVGFFTLFIFPVQAQEQTEDLFSITPTNSATDEARIASSSAEEQKKIEKIKKEDITQPETEDQKEFVALFSKRKITQVTPLNFMGYFVQNAVRGGVPANTIVLILLLPFLATMFVFFRQIIGLPSLEMWVSIALSITLLSTGITAGSILLITIVFASIIARFLLKRIRIMQLPKMALSIFVVSAFVFISLALSAMGGVLIVKQISIFPILLLILVGEKIIALQLTRSYKETLQITIVTILLGMVGFVILSLQIFRNYIILYPEVILILLPVNYIMGRYFGLRISEVFRFAQLRKYANQ